MKNNYKSEGKYDVIVVGGSSGAVCVCGELLDVNGYTGGYNLTAAFSTGHSAGSNIPKRTLPLYCLKYQNPFLLCEEYRPPPQADLFQKTPQENAFFSHKLPKDLFRTVF